MLYVCQFNPFFTKDYELRPVLYMIWHIYIFCNRTLFLLLRIKRY